MTSEDLKQAIVLACATIGICATAIWTQQAGCLFFLIGVVFLL